jgi:hypothetical protein
MRYIRFLKTPRIVAEKGSSKSHVYCLITITSDLGDSFFPHDVELAAELLAPKNNSRGSQESSDEEQEEVLVWRTVKWTAGMRTLGITLPLKKSYASRPLQVRVGLEPQNSYDVFDDLSQPDAHGIVSAWSAPFNIEGRKEAEKLVQRRFKIGRKVLRIWEETGESIDRHLWDAGITFSHHLSSLLSNSPEDPLFAALDTLHQNLKHASPPNIEEHDYDLKELHVMELGTGCGIVGLTLASLVPGCNVHMTDLPSAAEIVAKNEESTRSTWAFNTDASFTELNWDEKLADEFNALEPPLSLVVASDCTYNADSRYSFPTPSTLFLYSVALRHRHTDRTYN